jgi:Fe-S-cluster containining protein
MMDAPSREPPQELAAAWLAAVADEHIALELESAYEYTAAAIESRGPACWASGRCCNFDAAGHRLYVTGLEAAYSVFHLRRDRTTGPPLPLDLTPLTLASARARGGCPFQSANLCSIHATKPLGCRIYFCDRSAQAWQQDLSEKCLALVRSIHDRHRVPYRYGEWRDMLAMFL